MARFPFFLISGIVSFVVLANSACSLLQFELPSLALTLNPLNAEARVNLLAEGLRKSGRLNDPEIEELVKTGMKLSPADARLVSLHGIYQERSGDIQAAQKSYDMALAILPTEIQALLRKFLYQINEKNYSAAVTMADIVMRRWPKHWQAIEPYFPVILSNKSGFKKASEIFSISPASRRLLINGLVKNTNSLHLAVNLVQAWKKNGIDEIWPLANPITDKLISEKQSRYAYFFFHSLLNLEQKKKAGYIYNGEFTFEPTGNFFDWQIRRQAGVIQKIENKPAGKNTEASDTSNSGNYLEIQFLDNPIQYRGVSQKLRLVPGLHQLKLSFSTEELRAPKPIRLSIDCVQGQKRLSSIALATGTNPRVTETLTFTIPNQDCDIFELFFHNEFIPNSWRNRYSGKLNIHSVSIELLGS